MRVDVLKPPTIEAAPLTELETTALQLAESQIRQHMNGFIEVGKALLEIKDGRLYRAQFGTFEEYCHERWQIGKAHAYRLIGCSETMAILSPRGDIHPTCEKAMRPLLRFPIEARLKVWSDVLRQMPVDADGKPVVIASAVEREVNCLIRDRNDEPYRSIRRDQKEKARKAEKPSMKLWCAKRKNGPPFDLETTRENLQSTIRSSFVRCPVKHRDAVAELLIELANELKSMPDITCPNCGGHVADDDGDCVSCREPNIVK